jgi:hypothetical protein
LFFYVPSFFLLHFLPIWHSLLRDYNSSVMWLVTLNGLPIELTVQMIVEESLCGLFKILSQHSPVETSGSNLNLRTASFVSGILVFDLNTFSR